MRTVEDELGVGIVGISEQRVDLYQRTIRVEVHKAAEGEQVADVDADALPLEDILPPLGKRCEWIEEGEGYGGLRCE